MEEKSKFLMTRRQFLKGNILLVLAFLFSKFPPRLLKEALRIKKTPNVSDTEARFYSRLAG